MSLSPISQKAHDISFAVFRVATLIKNSKLRSEIEFAAVDLISHFEQIADSSLPFTTPNVVDKLLRLVSFAESIGEMKAINASVLKRELGNLQTAIDFHLNTYKGEPSGLSGKDKDNDIDISNMFPASTLSSGKDKASGKGLTTVVGDKVSPQSMQRGETLVDQPIEDFGSDISIRQTAILRNIREIEFCRLRNIMEAMPNVSERTIRNDIQGLIDRNLVRRVGGGGPNSYFETLELSTIVDKASPRVLSR